MNREHLGVKPHHLWVIWGNSLLATRALRLHPRVNYKLPLEVWFNYYINISYYGYHDCILVNVTHNIHFKSSLLTVHVYLMTVCSSVTITTVVVIHCEH